MMNYSTPAALDIGTASGEYLIKIMTYALPFFNSLRPSDAYVRH